jgi:hypothetical protein
MDQKLYSTFYDRTVNSGAGSAVADPTPAELLFRVDVGLFHLYRHPQRFLLRGTVWSLSIVCYNLN